MYSGVNKIVGILDEKKNGILTGKKRMCASVYQRWAGRVSPLQPHEKPQKEAKVLQVPFVSEAVDELV